MLKKLSYNSWSIRAKLITTILLCVILSIGMMGFYSYFYYTRSVSNKLQDAVHSETSSLTNIAVDKMWSVIELSRDITYAAEIEGIIIGNRRDNYGESLFNEYMNSSLLRKFYSRNEVLFAGVIVQDYPGSVFYYEPTGNNQVEIFKENVMKSATEHMKDDSREIMFLISDDNIYMIRNLFSIRDLSNLGCLIVQIREDYIFGHFDKNSVWSENLLYSINGIENSYGNLNEEVHSIEYVEQNMQLVSKGTEIFFDNNLLYVIDAQKSSDFELKCMSVVYQNKVYSSSQDIFSITVFLVVLIIPFIVIILYQVYKSISVPINKMVSAMKVVENGNFGVTYDYDKKDEFKYLFDSFNHMTKQMDSLIKNLYEEELASKDAKIMALQSQINPHFLNNTLEMLLWRARKLGDEETESMLEALCVIFNASMDRSSRRFIMLSEEIEYVAAYLYISEQRFKEKLKIIEDIDLSLSDILIPRLTIQPLMENAIKHGIEPIGSGTIWISIKREDDVAMIQIINNGKILSDDNAKRINNILNGTLKMGGRTSLGIKNLNERIKLLYGDQYGLTIYRDDQNRTVSRLIIPILYEDNI